MPARAAHALQGVAGRRVLLVGPWPLASRRTLEPLGLVLSAIEDVPADSDESFDAALSLSPYAGDPERVQGLLRPGGAWGFLDVTAPSARRLTKGLTPFFDIERTTAGTLRARRRRARELTSHFETLAPEYWAELPPHIQDQYMRTKLAFLRTHLPPTAADMRLRGLDLGCGLGQFTRALGEDGVTVIGIDPSRTSLAVGRNTTGSSYPAGFAAADSGHLPFQDASFDFAYAVNMLHHLKRGEQERALREVRRVLRPGGVFLLLEINIRNPLFRWYMKRVFPRTRRIDRGDEEFIHPDRLPLVPEFSLEKVEYATFAPDFLPGWALRAAAPIERDLLAGRWARHAIHYMAVLRPSQPQKSME